MSYLSVGTFDGTHHVTKQRAITRRKDIPISGSRQSSLVLEAIVWRASGVYLDDMPSPENVMQHATLMLDSNSSIDWNGTTLNGEDG